MKQIQNLAKETVFYGLGNIIPRLLNFLLFPLHTRVFDPEEYGVISYLYVFVAFLNIVYTFGMETAYFRFANKPGADPEKIFSRTQSVVVTLSLALSVLLIVFADPLATALRVEGHSHYIVWLAVIMFIDAVVAIPFARLRQEKKPKQFAFARIANVVILIGLNLYFFVVATWVQNGSITFQFEELRNGPFGLAYVFLANLIANAFYILFFFKLLTSWRLSFDREITRAMLRYAYPVMITGLAGMTNEMFSRWTLEWWLPENFYPGQPTMYAIGLLSTAYKYAILMSLAIQAFRYAAEPFFFSHANNKESPVLFARVNHYFIVFLSFVFVLVAVNLDLLKFLVAPDYYPALRVVPLLLLSYFLLGAYYNYSVWFKVTDRTEFGTYITMGGALVTVGLNYLLIPQFGFVGSAWASVACYLLMAIACVALGQRHYRIPYHFGSDLAYVVMAIGFYFLSLTLQLNNPYFQIAWQLLLTVLYAVSAWLIERKNWKQSAR